MMDAHMRFRNKWDKLLMDNWNRLGDELAILTTYPQGYVVRDEPLREVRKLFFFFSFFFSFFFFFFLFFLFFFFFFFFLLSPFLFFFLSLF